MIYRALILHSSDVTSTVFFAMANAAFVNGDAFAASDVNVVFLGMAGKTVKQTIKQAVATNEAGSTVLSFVKRAASLRFLQDLSLDGVSVYTSHALVLAPKVKLASIDVPVTVAPHDGAAPKGLLFLFVEMNIIHQDHRSQPPLRRRWFSC